MRWNFKWRKELSSGQYYRQLLPRGFVKPEDQEPFIDGFEFYLDAFRELSSCRPGGLDLQAIPFTAIAQYSSIYELGDFEEFAYVIRAMDNVFLEMNGAVQKKERDKSDAARSADPKNHNPR